MLWETSLSLVSESSLLLFSLGVFFASMCSVMSYAPS